MLWRVGVAANVLVVVLAVPLLGIEYLLLRPVSGAQPAEARSLPGQYL